MCSIAVAASILNGIYNGHSAYKFDDLINIHTTATPLG